LPLFPAWSRFQHLFHEAGVIMRSLAFTLAAAAAAQPPAAPPPAPATPQDYVCAFAGDCSDTTADDQNQAQPGELAGHPGISATRGFALSRPTPEGAARPRPRGTPRVAGQAVHRAPAAAAGQRVNLRLAFDTGSARLTPDAMAQAGVFARALMLPQLVTMHFRIEGHTDSVGSRAMNMDLSQRRAQAVADFLVGMGVARDRLDVRGYGFDQPLPGTSAADGQNRRVEAVRTS
jgi:outer membrane protein OmpA-like peptidoglycan-associated protein